MIIEYARDDGKSSRKRPVFSDPGTVRARDGQTAKRRPRAMQHPNEEGAPYGARQKGWNRETDLSSLYGTEGFLFFFTETSGGNSDGG